MTQPGKALLLFALALSSAIALAQAPTRVRGTITAFDGKVLSVKSRDGKDLVLHLAEKTTVSVARAIKFEDIKPGDYVGSTAMPGSDGRLVAVEVHYLPPAAPAGHTPWDLQPGSTMTNANVAAVQSAGARELTLQYKDGSQKIVVPEGAPIVRAAPGTLADLKVGEYIFSVVPPSPDGKLTALRIQVSKDGVRPPQ